MRKGPQGLVKLSLWKAVCALCALVLMQEKLRTSFFKFVIGSKWGSFGVAFAICQGFRLVGVALWHCGIVDCYQ